MYQLEMTLDMKEFCVFSLRKWKNLLVIMLVSCLVFCVLRVILNLLTQSLFSMFTLLAYAIVGLVMGAILFVLWAFYLYRKDGKIRDVSSFCEAYHLFVLGDLSDASLPQRNVIDRLLNRWVKHTPVPVQEEWALIAGRIHAIAGQDSKKILVTGTDNDGATKEAFQHLEEKFGNQGNSLLESGNPLDHVEIMDQMEEVQVVLVEKKDHSVIAEVGRLLHFFDKCGIQIIGIIVL